MPRTDEGLWHTRTCRWKGRAAHSFSAFLPTSVYQQMFQACSVLRAPPHLPQLPLGARGKCPHSGSPLQDERAHGPHNYTIALFTQHTIHHSFCMDSFAAVPIFSPTVQRIAPTCRVPPPEAKQPSSWPLPLAAALLWACMAPLQHGASAAFWRLYRSALPQPSELTCLTMFTPGELAMLHAHHCEHGSTHVRAAGSQVRTTLASSCALVMTTVSMSAQKVVVSSNGITFWKSKVLKCAGRHG